MKAKWFFPVICGLAALSSTSAGASVVTFNNTPIGNQSQGFSATGEPGIAFYTNAGTVLAVHAFGISDGRALAVFNDNADYLKGVMANLTSSLTLSFGNDGPPYTSVGDMAVLKTYLDGNLVGTSSVAFNRNYLADQTISSTGGTFNSFTFVYTNSSGTPINLGEIVDDVQFTAAPPVPEPSTWAMMILGFAGVSFLAYRRRHQMAAVS